MLNLNGKPLPSWVKLESIETSVLPPIINNTLKVRGKAGVHLLSQQLDTRTIKANIIIKAEPYQVLQKMHELAEWLYHKKPVKLIMADDVERYYLVLPDGETNIEELITLGFGTLSFICTEPFSFSTYETTVEKTAMTSEPFYFTVGGNTDTYPVIDMTLTEDVDNVAVVSDNGFVLIGDPTEEPRVKKRTFERRIDDEMETTNGWSNSSFIEDGVIKGTFAPIGGNAVAQASDNYGTAEGEWHGAAMQRSLTTTIQDFKTEVWFRLNTASRFEMARFEVYLYDQNGEHITRVTFQDSNLIMPLTMTRVRLGDVNEGKTLMSATNPRSLWDDFYGRMRIQRIGNKWEIEVAKYDSDKEEFVSRVSTKYTDAKKKYTQKLAGIKLHVGTFSGVPKPNNLRIYKTVVSEYVELSGDSTPIIAEKGDIIRIDCGRSIVYKNGEAFYQGINPASNFFSLEKGVNGLSVTSEGAKLKVRFRERWL